MIDETRKIFDSITIDNETLIKSKIIIYFKTKYFLRPYQKSLQIGVIHSRLLKVSRRVGARKVNRAAEFWCNIIMKVVYALPSSLN